MICLDAIVQNGYDHPFSGVAFLPGGCHVHIEAILGAAVLRSECICGGGWLVCVCVCVLLSAIRIGWFGGRKKKKKTKKEKWLVPIQHILEMQ